LFGKSYIRQPYGPARSNTNVTNTAQPPGQSSLADYPELPFEKEWGQLVRRARVDQKLTQLELAGKVGCEQAMISNIENWAVHSSRAVTPIVAVLNIPGPAQYFTDDLDRRWLEVGRLLRGMNTQTHAALLEAAEAMVRGKAKPDR